MNGPLSADHRKLVSKKTIPKDHRVFALWILAQLFSRCAPWYIKVLSAIYQGVVHNGYFNTFAQFFFSEFCPIISKFCPIIWRICPIIYFKCFTNNILYLPNYIRDLTNYFFQSFAQLDKGLAQLFQGFAQLFK